MIVTREFPVASGVSCEKCRKPTHIHDELVDEFFHGALVVCDACSNESTLYSLLLSTLSIGIDLFNAAPGELIGLESKSLTVEIKAFQVTEIDYTKCGVPDGSTIVMTNYTASGSVVPLEMHGNTPIREPQLQTFLYGRDLSGNNDSSNEVYILISYIPPVGNDSVLYSLAKGYQHFLSEKWGQMAIALVTGIEFSLKQSMKDFVPKWASVKDKAYLEQVYPDYCREKGIPLPERLIMEKVSRLWGVRDKYAHTGTLFPGYEKTAAAEQLCSALLLYRHIKRFCS